MTLTWNATAQYTAYDRLTQIYTAYRTRRAGGKGYKLGDRDIFLLGAVAKALATAGTYPYVSPRGIINPINPVGYGRWAG